MNFFMMAAGGIDADVLNYAARVSTAGGTLSSTDKSILSTFANTLKSNSIWNKIKDMGVFFGGFSGCFVKLKYADENYKVCLNSGTTLFGSSDYDDAFGLTSPAANRKIDTQIIPDNVGLSSQNFSMGYFFTKQVEFGTKYHMCENPATDFARFIVGSDTTLVSGQSGGVAASLQPTFRALSASPSTCVALANYMNALTSNTPANITIHDSSISIFKGRNQGVDVYSKGTVSFYFIGEYLTYDELVILENAVKALLISKGRYSEQDELIPFGDSITIGSSASARTDRYSWLLADAFSLRERNSGISGSRLINDTSTIPGGYPRRLELSKYNITPNTKLIIQYGVNDVLVDTGDGTPATIALFQQRLIDLVNDVLSYGYAAGNIQIGSISILGGSVSIARQQAYVEAARQAAIATGVKYADVWQYMTDNGGTATLLSGDNIHPNTAGHAAIATAHETLADFV